MLLNIYICSVIFALSWIYLYSRSYRDIIFPLCIILSFVPAINCIMVIITAINYFYLNSVLDNMFEEIDKQLHLEKVKK